MAGGRQCALEGGNTVEKSSQTTVPLVSEFACDEDMVELVEMFVQELPLRIASIEEAMALRDLDSLARLVHQLKGAAGGYGFPSITEAATQLEDTAQAADDLEKLTSETKDLVALCARARATQTEA